MVPDLAPTVIPATIWQLRTRTLALSGRPLLMGIINVTPDSFSDGGRFLEPKAAIAQAQKLAAEGADLLDIGGESTRPGAQGVSHQQELERILPVVEGVCQRVHIPLSIDTSKAEVARAAIDAGAEIINDVSALRADPQMLPLALQTGAAICAMHMQGTPQTMQDNPHYENVTDDVLGFLRQTRDFLTAAGVPQARICLDPGIGFGKTPQHNLTLLSNCWRLHELGCPVLIGHSRKSFLGHLLHDPFAYRLPATIGIACALAAQGVQILRVHEVAPIRQALQLFQAAGSLRLRSESSD